MAKNSTLLRRFPKIKRVTDKQKKRNSQRAINTANVTTRSAVLLSVTLCSVLAIIIYYYHMQLQNKTALQSKADHPRVYDLDIDP